jgi:hypothetical protein
MAGDINANQRRDFIGYGQQRPKVTWPNKAELAVFFVVNLEECADASFRKASRTTTSSASPHRPCRTGCAI